MLTLLELKVTWHLESQARHEPFNQPQVVQAAQTKAMPTLFHTKF
jgi:hypothetical protein